MKALLRPALASLLLASPALANIITEPPRHYSFAYTLADLEDPPQSFALAVSDSAITSLTQVRVGLQLSGATPGSGFASEMFVSLTKDFSLTSVLLNQVGIGAGDPIGHGYDGWNVTFDDVSGAGDIHQASLVAGVLGGVWQADGRLNPADSSRPAGLGVFAGVPGNGSWHLNVADLELGGTMRLTGWSLILTGEAGDIPLIPEGGTGGGGVFIAGAVMVGLWRRARPNARN
jgi:hypothetical protein